MELRNVHLTDRESVRYVHVDDDSSIPYFNNGLPPWRFTEDMIFCRWFRRLWHCVVQPKPQSCRRYIHFSGHTVPRRFVKNVVRNQRYNVITFVPLVLVNQFRMFFNFYYLLISILQIIPIFRIGPLFTYLGPLGFVLLLTFLKELSDELKRYSRDKAVNNELVETFTACGVRQKKAADLLVGEVVVVKKGMRVPCDVLFIKTNDQSGVTYVKTDQLDGETDWKRKIAVSCTQCLDPPDILHLDAVVEADRPMGDIRTFEGRIVPQNTTPSSGKRQGLCVDNVLWMNTIVTTGPILGLVLYTSPETRAVLNTSAPRVKTGRLDEDVNFMSKVLFGLLFILALFLTISRGIKESSIIMFARFLLLLSSIIPISLRVNLDMSKTLFSYLIAKDVPGTVVRTSTIPEELGQVDFILTDKTGTLTKNEMTLKDLLTPDRNHFDDSLFTMLQTHVSRRFVEYLDTFNPEDEICALVFGMATCHSLIVAHDETGGDVLQSSSPDETAIVEFTASLGVRLIHRTDTSITLGTPGGIREFDVLLHVPFSSDKKRMAIMIRDAKTKFISVIVKGADTVIAPLVSSSVSRWIDEAGQQLGNNGRRVLVFAMKHVKTEEDAERLIKQYTEACAVLGNRAERQMEALRIIESNLTLLGLSGVEDKLQDDVPEALEALKDAGIRIWMLTGDKLETAKTVAVAAGLRARDDPLTVLDSMTCRSMEDIESILYSFEQSPTHGLLVDGAILGACLSPLFVQAASKAKIVICSRCAPMDKARVATEIQRVLGARVVGVGDGGNDVSMIQASSCGIGIVGKEGMHASLAADFSISEFQSLKRLIMLHGRRSYLGSARLTQFVIHRGMIIAYIQFLFSSIFYFTPVALFQGWLTVGYATYYTMAPVFCLVLDVDVDESVVFLYPELYSQVRSGRMMGLHLFFSWVWRSVYQGSVIMIGSILLFESQFNNIISISFTSLVMSELLNVVTEISHWSSMMVVAETATVMIYILSMFILRSYFDPRFICTSTFWWKTSVITLASWLPIHILKVLRKFFVPPQYAKLK